MYLFGVLPAGCWLLHVAVWCCTVSCVHCHHNKARCVDLPVVLTCATWHVQREGVWNVLQLSAVTPEACNICLLAGCDMACQACLCASLGTGLGQELSSQTVGLVLLCKLIQEQGTFVATVECHPTKRSGTLLSNLALAMQVHTLGCLAHHPVARVDCFRQRPVAHAMMPIRLHYDFAKHTVCHGQQHKHTVHQSVHLMWPVTGQHIA